MTTVLFICQSNKGKSQMAEALMNLHSGGRVRAISAGTKAAVGQAVNAESAASVAQLGADMSAGTPKFASAEDLAAADRIVIVGDAAQLEDATPDVLAKVERWSTDEPSKRGIEGKERMNLIRDDIDARVQKLLAELG
ncbi:MAG: low molecular weight phosphatase family protein [Rothia sp. (in: high G+C Gram-positive bacteria)]|nr:low molecular weight phosphatase family protein [Rothia sp. (in: high G+C Gram-positive bacteria)]